MANLSETATYDVGVYQIETTDLVLGGPDGPDNKAAKNLANRTAYLKQHVDALEVTVPANATAASNDATAKANAAQAAAATDAATKANAAIATAAADATAKVAAALVTSASDATTKASAAQAAAIAAAWSAGDIKTTAATTVPSGWYECNGAAVSRTTDAALFAAIGTTYGVGDGATTFNLPDYRGVFLRGLDGGRGLDASRAIGSYQDDAFQGHRMGPLSGTTTFYGRGSGNGAPSGDGSNFNAATTGDPITDGTNGTPRTASETRPKNVAVKYLIRR